MLSVCSLFFIFAYLILSFICFDCMLFVLMFCLCFCCVLISAFVWKSLFTYIKVRMHSENVQIFSKEEITFCVRSELLVSTLKFDCLFISIWYHGKPCFPCTILQNISQKKISSWNKRYLSGVTFYSSYTCWV